MVKGKIEIALHIIFWIFILFSINVNWNSDWFDQSLRTKTPAPLFVIILPIYFYINAFILIPKFFSFEKWKQYVIYSAILFILPELIRIIVYMFKTDNSSIESLIFNRDSFIFGAPSVFFLALNTSFIYRLTLDWLRNKEGNTKNQTPETNKPTIPYENNALLDNQQAEELKELLQQKMHAEALYLNPDLSLGELAESVKSSEKKVSYLINQHLDSNFYEWVNRYRINRFKEQIAIPENRKLSIVGVAMNCGFSSKSSFYRAFKTEVGVSPSQYLKKQEKPQ